MIESLKQNIETEIRMLREISSYTQKLTSANETETKLLKGAINALRNSMRLINNSIPSLLDETAAAKKLPSATSQKKSSLENVSYKTVGKDIKVTLRSADRDKFFRELNISEQLIKQLKKREKNDKEIYTEFKASRGYLKWSNKMFLGLAREYVSKGRFKDLKAGLRRANIDILFESYVAMLFFSVFVSIIVGVIITAGLLIFEYLPTWPFIGLRMEGHLTQLGKIFWIPFAVPILTFFMIYFYPSTERSSIGKKIDQELPFAVIHMSAISGSGIEPSEIFKIIGLNKEYPYLRKEIRKVLNQINLYGYDLTTALANAAKTAPSENLSELFSGLSTTITSGANLSEFFEKRAETLLLAYRLEREKYTRLVETFLDIYISIVIAAPMIFLLLIVMMAISGLSVGMTPFQLSFLAVSTIALLNLVFLVFLHLKQPTY